MNTFTLEDSAMLRRYAAEHSLSLRWGESDEGGQWTILGHEGVTTITRQGGGYTALDAEGSPLARVHTLSAVLAAI